MVGSARKSIESIGVPMLLSIKGLRALHATAGFLREHKSTPEHRLLLRATSPKGQLLWVFFDAEFGRRS